MQGSRYLVGRAGSSSGVVGDEEISVKDRREPLEVRWKPEAGRWAWALTLRDDKILKQATRT